MIQVSKHGRFIQAKLSLDLILIEILIEILAHSLMRDNIADPGRALVVTRELLRGLCLNCKRDRFSDREASACFESLEKGMLRILVQESGAAASAVDLYSAFQATSELGTIQRLSESVRFEGDTIEAIVAFCPI